MLPNGIDPDEIARLTPAGPARVVAPSAAGARTRRRRSFLSVGRLEAYKGFDDMLRRPRRARTTAARCPRDWAWVVVGDGRERRRRRCADAAATAPRGPRAPGRAASSESAAARALRARRRLRARHALRGLQPGDAGGDGPRPAGGGDARRRHPRQGGGRRDRAAWSRPATSAALAVALAELLHDAARRRAMGARGRAAGRCARSPGRALVDRTLALYDELLAR